jgi:formate hydrogenlyase subunit 4
MIDALLRLSIGLSQGTLVILLAPGIAGLLRYFKAGLQQRRRGPGTILQPYRDLLKLMRKPAVRSETTSWFFAITPAVLFVAYGLLVFLVPVFHRATLAQGDLIVVIYLLGLARFVLSLAGLDAGAPFGGLGSSREMFLHFLTEIGLVLIIGALMLRWETVSLSGLFEYHWALGVNGFLLRPELGLLALSLALLILLESGRIPIDNPATNLELTMAHKAIELEYAGRDLALIEWAEMIKLAFLLTLLGNLFMPFPALPGATSELDLLESGLALAAYALKIVGLVLCLALWEMSRPKLRLRAVVGPGLVAMALSLTTIIYIVATKLGG